MDVCQPVLLAVPVLTQWAHGWRSYSSRDRGSAWASSAQSWSSYCHFWIPDVLTTEIKDELLIWYHFSRSPAIHLSPSWCPQDFITLYGTVIHPFWNWSHQIFTGLSGASANIIPVFTECLFTVMGAYLTAFQTRNLILQWRRCGNGHMSIESSRLTISHITWEWNRRLDWPMGPFTPQLESVGHRHPWARAFQGTQVLWVLVFP